MARTLDPDLIETLRSIVGEDGVLTSPEELLPYECDGVTVARVQPSAVVFVHSTQQTADVIRLLNEHNVPFAPRGAGTSLSAGTLPLHDAVFIETSRMDRILELDIRNEQVRVQAGAINQKITDLATPHGYCFAPDPGSQTACTIGGNIAYNSGGPHTLKYGVTVNHLLGVTLVTAEGEIVEAGGPAEDPVGYDLTGAICGCEGTFGVITEAVLRLLPIAESQRTMLAAFDSTQDAINCVSDMIGEGIVPVALEFMDQIILRAVEDAYHFGLPRDAEAILIVEIEGLDAGLDRQADRIVEMCERHSARHIRRAKSAQERAELWMCRKKAFGAIGRLSSSYVTEDGVVPRTQLPELMRAVNEIAQRNDVRIAAVFHAGDGNIHPIALIEEGNPEQEKRALAASSQILDKAIELGGSPTGEHGIGVVKTRHLAEMYSPEDLEAMQRLRRVFDPNERSNTTKVFGGEGLPEVFLEMSAETG